MTILEIIFSGQFLIAIFIHTLLIIIGMMIFEYLHHRYSNPFLELIWDKVAVPLYRALVIAVFVLLTYPIIYGINEAPELSRLLFQEDGRFSSIVNVLFLISLFFPLIPFIGKHIALVLFLQTIACCVMVFSWVAEYYQLSDYNTAPGFSILMIIFILAIITHYLSTWLALNFGDTLDKRFNLDGCKEIIAPSLNLLMQAPIILLYSTSLGEQLL